MPLSFFRRRAHLKKKVIPWKMNIMGTQDYAPRDLSVRKKMGIKQGERVLVFAGYFGEWARALTPKTRVTFTDPSAEYTRAFKAHQSEARVKTIPGEIIPTKNGTYDWSFSFEPFPLVGHGGIIHTISHSLMNKGGVKIAYSNQDPARNTQLRKIASQVASVYGAQVTETRFSADMLRSLDTLRKRAQSDAENLRFSEASPVRETINLLTIRTNPAARRMADIDASVMNLVDKEIKQREGKNYARVNQRNRVIKPTKQITQKDYSFALTIIPALSRRLGLSERETLQSINRLKKMADIYSTI